MFTVRSSSPTCMLLLPVALLCNLVHAQAPAERYGPKLGVSMASISASGTIGWNGLPKFGPLGGWSFEVPVSRQTGLLIEPMVMGKGSITVNNVQRTRTDVSLLYVEMPLMLKLSLSPDTQGTYLTGGLLYGYRVYGSVRNFLDGQEVSRTGYSTTQSRSQLSLGLGLGLERGNWLFELRGQSSLGILSRIATTNNVVISLQIAWRFPEPRKEPEEDEEGDEDEAE